MDLSSAFWNFQLLAGIAIMLIGVALGVTATFAVRYAYSMHQCTKLTKQHTNRLLLARDNLEALED